jgi:uncharacterized protein YndB with AHSA1/START domain
MTDADLGTLEQRDDKWSITFTRRLRHSPDKVWRAVTEPEHLAVWFPQELVGERRAGAPLKFVSPQGDAFEGEMIVFDPPSVMELLWGTDRLRIEVRPDDDGNGTVLTLIDTFAELGKAARDATGWHECLHRLAHALAGTEPPKWGASWRDINAEYVARFGPEGSSIGPPPGWEPEQ